MTMSIMLFGHFSPMFTATTTTLLATATTIYFHGIWCLMMMMVMVVISGCSHAIQIFTTTAAASEINGLDVSSSSIFDGFPHLSIYVCGKSR